MLLTREQLQERLIALHRASLELIKDVSLEHLLERIAATACEQAGARYAALGVLDEDGGLKKFITVGMTEEEIKRMAHPPLGKDLIALGVLVFGMTPFGWRITGTLVGALMLPVMYMFGKRLFSSRSYGVAAAFLMMFDFMHFTQTRVATVDTFVTIFITLMYYYMFVYYSRTGYEAGYKASLRPLLLCGLFFGLGCATKWNAVYGAPGLLLIFLMAKFREYRDYRKALAEGAKQAWVGEYVSGYLFGTIGWCLVFFILIPAAVYVVSYIPFFLVPGPGHGLSDLPALQSHMYNYHKTLVATHPFQSRWWEWPLMLKPVWFYVSSALPAGRTSTIVALGNPAISQSTSSGHILVAKASNPVVSRPSTRSI